jgi:hypothetical protein
MPNQWWKKFTGSGAKTGQSGPKHDSVEPIKTKNWPDIPGKTQPKTRNFGFRKVKGGAAEKGI